MYCTPPVSKNCKEQKKDMVISLTLTLTKCYSRSLFAYFSPHHRGNIFPCNLPTPTHLKDPHQWCLITVVVWLVGTDIAPCDRWPHHPPHSHSQKRPRKVFHERRLAREDRYRPVRLVVLPPLVSLVCSLHELNPSQSRWLILYPCISINSAMDSQIPTQEELCKPGKVG